MVKRKELTYPSNGYMNGVCPGCKEWEAPITQAELEGFAEEYAHHGSTEKKLDSNSSYNRKVWDEKFQCPKCKERFSVGFSNM